MRINIKAALRILASTWRIQRVGLCSVLMKPTFSVVLLLLCFFLSSVRAEEESFVDPFFLKAFDTRPDAVSVNITVFGEFDGVIIMP
jgi:hypothetical protein